MKNIFYSLLVIFIFFTACTQDNETDELMTKSELSKDNTNKKITICHKDKETISISVNALQAHLDHGDKIGPCGYTYVPDDNFENALAAFDDIPNDNLVPTDNISGITELIISGKFIQDLTGIEDFTSLETLDVSFNELTSLVVSNNLNLIALNCRDNKIIGLDLSGLDKLEKLNCHFNELTNLIFSKNPKLAILSFYNNSITEIDLSDMPELIRIHGAHNLLDNMNITNTPKLNVLECAFNNLKHLDLSQNTALGRVWVRFNKLETLNIKNGNNMNITQFIAEDNPSLSCIQVDNAAYSTANWTRVDSGTSFSENCGY